MSRLDRYILAQLMGLFGFFALVLVSVYWVNQAVQLFDRLIGDGQSALVVLELTALTLPYVIRLLLPLAAFAATIYAINRMSTESELVVMQATGLSPWRMARPVLVFGVLVSVMVAVLTNELVPAARARLAERQSEISQNVTARFLTEGSFMHPAADVTIYIRAITEHGELMDLFLSDGRNPANRTIYTAQKALIVRGADDGSTPPKLIMFDGMAQVLDLNDARLSVTHFADFTYDLGGLFSTSVRQRSDLREWGTGSLMFDAPDVIAQSGRTQTDITTELQERLALPLLSPVSAMLGFAALMLGGFSRFGVWKQSALAIAALILVQLLVNTSADAVRRMPSAWLLHYLPATVGAAIALMMLWWAARPRRIRPPLVTEGAAPGPQAGAETGR
ncbi:LPS export ABC transporter permease LptF [Phaeovulum sp. W22_SRMD_FR3]|uniref:LPS export ABC transporter permease LptF n=1 Tax=Phaeovulum sp. W22_SRMD_FR3 TaxID=3240274 RepID=UPI003F987257